MQIEEYIKKQKEKGFSDSEIKEKLLKSKYSNEVIEKAFVNLSEPEKLKKPGNLKILKILLIILVVVVIISIAYFFISKSSNGLGKGVEGTDEPEFREESPAQEVITILESPPTENISFAYVTCKALAQNEVELCSLIIPGALEDLSLYAKCQNTFYTTKAYSNKDESFCDKLNSSIDYYRDPLATTGETDDKVICKYVVNELKSTSSVELCGRAFDESDKFLECQALFDINCDLCGQISDLERKNGCMNKCTMISGQMCS